jgi:hypothetical protein
MYMCVCVRESRPAACCSILWRGAKLAFLLLWRTARLANLISMLRRGQKHRAQRCNCCNELDLTSVWPLVALRCARGELSCGQINAHQTDCCIPLMKKSQTLHACTAGDSSYPVAQCVLVMNGTERNCKMIHSALSISNSGLNLIITLAH